MPTYRELQSASSAACETRDCTVKTLAILADLPYGEAHYMLKGLGRKNRRGFLFNPRFNARTVDLFAALGYNLKPVPASVWTPGPRVPYCCTRRVRTLRTLPEALPTGRYMVFTRGHVCALVNGTIEDWAHDKRKHVRYVFEVTPK